jgi:Transposase
MTAEDGADRRCRDLHPKAQQFSLDALVAPTGILPGEADDELLDVLVERGSPCSTQGTVTVLTAHSCAPAAATVPEPIRSPVTMTRMTHPPQSHQADTGSEEVVLGVDTHKDTHVAAVLDPVGALLASRCFATTTAGYQQLLGWAQTLGTLRRAGVECTGSYGAALTRHLRAAGVQVLEVNQPDKATRRRRGKTPSMSS